jgi:hypothetical protein
MLTPSPCGYCGARRAIFHSGKTNTPAIATAATHMATADTLEILAELFMIVS